MVHRDGEQEDCGVGGHLADALKECEIPGHIASELFFGLGRHESCLLELGQLLLGEVHVCPLDDLMTHLRQNTSVLKDAIWVISEDLEVQAPLTESPGKPPALLVVCTAKGS